MPASPFTDRATAEFSGAEKRALLALARAAIMAELRGEPAPALPDDPRLLEEGACFVTLKAHGELRGCIGTLAAHRPLAPARRKAELLRFARRAARRLSAQIDPSLGDAT